MASFHHPNYLLQDNERIVRRAQAPEITLQDEISLLTEVGRFIQAKLIHEYGFEMLMIPDDETAVNTSILVTSDWLTNPNILVVVQNAVSSMMGIFSRSLCLEQGLSKGSMIPYIDRARRAGYAVMVLRPSMIT